MTARYRADHLGSLLRPPELLAARSNPGVTAAELRDLEDRCIDEALSAQQQAGLRIFSDGEFRRLNFMSDFNESVEGLDAGEEIGRTWQGQSGAGVSRVAGVAVGRIRPRKRLTQHEVEYLRSHSPGDFKITLPSANQFPAIAFKRGISDRVYANHSELLWDAVPVIRAEVQALVAEGVPYVQIDAPRYSYFIDPKWRDYVRSEMQMDPDAALEEAIRADNACIENARGRGSLIAIHLCRGNNRSQWYAEGGYDAIAEKLFGGLKVDAFLLEYDTERSGGFEPLRFVPRGATVVLGLISSKTPGLESKDGLRRRIEEASRYVDLDDLALSPQCGFASTMEGNLLSPEEQWQKLRLVVETAREVWGQA
jgi:5-methyltetrahydropteroyltriglutamate--homocysteine methyltransferase